MRKRVARKVLKAALPVGKPLRHRRQTVVRAMMTLPVYAAALRPELVELVYMVVRSRYRLAIYGCGCQLPGMLAKDLPRSCPRHDKPRILIRSQYDQKIRDSLER